jgi:glycerol-3-phosphate dehydrogenase
MQFGLVFESVRERLAGMRMAPHLARPLPFVFPRYHGDKPGKTRLGLGLWIYDVMAGFQSIKRHRRLSPSVLHERLPQLRTDGLCGAYEYYDAQTDDARLCLEIIIDAAALGANVLNRIELVDACRDGEKWVCGVRNLLDGGRHELHTRHIAIATGPWLGDTAALFGGGSGPAMRPTKGVHVHVPSDKLQLDTAIVMTHPDDGRVMFAIPTETSVLVGTTDTDHAGVGAELTVTAAEVEYLLNALAHYFPAAQVTPQDVHSAYAGLRPLLDGGGSGNTSQISREHRVFELARNVHAIGGGKLTTWRVMANDLLQAKGLAVNRELGSYRDRPLPGGRGIADRAQLELKADTLVQSHNLSHRAARTLVYTYGANADAVVAGIAANAAPVSAIGALELPAAAFEYAVTDEYALSLDDLMRRRSRLYYTEPDQGRQAAEAVAKIIAPLLGWSGEDVQSELQAYTDICDRYQPV